MKYASAALEAHLAEEVTTLTTCWKIVRTDGQALYFTEHDGDILFGGNVYKASTGYTRSAVANDASLSVDNLDLLGVLDSAEISAEELRAGLYDYARVEVFLVNWMDLTQGELKLRAGTLGEVTLHNNETFTAELRGITQALHQNMGELYSVACRVDFGSTKCGVLVLVTTVWAASTVVAEGAPVVPTYGVQLEYILPVPNMGAENGNMLDWSQLSPSGATAVVQDANGLLPYEGSWMFELSHYPEEKVWKDITIIDYGINIADTLRLQGWQANPYPDDKGQLQLLALDSGGGTLATVVSPLVGYTDQTWRFAVTTDLVVPAGTVKVRILMDSQFVTGTYANHCFDALQLVRTSAVANGLFPVYFECTTGGTTDATEPAWPETVGTPVVETGGVEWVSKAHLTRKGFVSSSTDNSTFTSSVLSDAPEDFDGGALTWVTGNNAGRVCEVKTATITGLTLFLPVFYPIQAGDEFTVVVGCDKHLSTCRDTFSNALNFRGEPFIPGQDEFLQYPDAK